VNYICSQRENDEEYPPFVIVVPNESTRNSMKALILYYTSELYEEKEILPIVLIISSSLLNIDFKGVDMTNRNDKDLIMINFTFWAKQYFMFLPSNYNKFVNREPANAFILVCRYLYKQDKKLSFSMDTDCKAITFTCEAEFKNM
jgi:hypothetical protein